MRIKYEITEEDKEIIREALRREKKASVRDRLMAISMVFGGKKRCETSIELNKNKEFAGKCLKRYFKYGIEGLKERRGGDRKSKLTDKEKEELIHIINTTVPINQKVWDGKSISSLVEARYGKKYKEGSIYAVLKGLNITCKVATKKDPKKAEEKIDEFKEDVKKTF